MWLSSIYRIVIKKEKRRDLLFVFYLCYGPADVGVLVLPVRFWYVDVCIIISFACFINSSASPVTDQCKSFYDEYIFLTYTD